MNLTERQIELIEDLLKTYTRKIYYGVGKLPEETMYFVFDNKVYHICKVDYDKVCEIIDYIKGVKK